MNLSNCCIGNELAYFMGLLNYILIWSIAQNYRICVLEIIILVVKIG